MYDTVSILLVKVMACFASMSISRRLYTCSLRQIGDGLVFDTSPCL